MGERDWQAARSGPPSGCTASARDQVLARKLTVDECGSVRVAGCLCDGSVLDGFRIARHTMGTMQRAIACASPATGSGAARRGEVLLGGGAMPSGDGCAGTK
jgi:hypothetical protein